MRDCRPKRLSEKGDRTLEFAHGIRLRGGLRGPVPFSDSLLAIRAFPMKEASTLRDTCFTSQAPLSSWPSPSSLFRRVNLVGWLWLIVSLIVLGLGVAKQINLLILLACPLVALWFIQLLVGGRGVARLTAPVAPFVSLFSPARMYRCDRGNEWQSRRPPRQRWKT